MRWGKGYKNLPSKSPVLLELLLLFHIQEASLITAIYPTKLSDFLLWLNLFLATVSTKTNEKIGHAVVNFAEFWWQNFRLVKFHSVFWNTAT